MTGAVLSQEKKRFREWFPTRPSDVPRFMSELGMFLQSMVRLRRLHNIHAGKRCFILGNGPSLARTNLQPLRNELTFALNRGYLLFDQLGFATTYLVSVNRLVIEQFGRELADLPCTTFLSWYLRDAVPFSARTIFIRPDFKPRFSTNLVTQGICEGTTVTFVAMQLAYYMGCSSVILLGVDHSFQTKGAAHQTVVSVGDDPDHFDPRYFGKGVRWQLPDLETSERAYRLAREHFEANGREIVDATIGGKLAVFRKVSYEEILM